MNSKQEDSLSLIEPLRPNETISLPDIVEPRCVKPWAGSWLYIYLSLTCVLFVITIIGMLNVAYNRTGTTKRRIYSKSV